jgi:hypothetical protein
MFSLSEIAAPSLRSLIDKARVFLMVLVITYLPFLVFYIYLETRGFNEILFCILSFTYSVAGGLACGTVFLLPIMNQKRQLGYSFVSQLFSSLFTESEATDKSTNNDSGKHSDISTIIEKSGHSHSTLTMTKSLRITSDLHMPLRNSDYSGDI